MEPRRQQQNGLSYDNLFNLEPLMNFRLPKPSEEFDTYGSSSQEESTSSQGQGAMTGYSNGSMTDRSSGHTKKQKRRGFELETGLSPYGRRDADSNDQDDEDYNTRISEDHYRSMLSDHVQKYRKVRVPDSSVPNVRRNHSSKAGKFTHEPFVKEEAMFREMDNSPEYFDADFESDYGGENKYGSPLDSSYLDIGEGITYRIPPTYDLLVTSLNLPSFSDIRIDEYFLKGTLDLRSLAAFVASDRKFEARNRGGLAEPQPQYESLQARLKALSASNSNQKFSLKVCDDHLDSIPEG
ncbi:DNA helicase INO80-like, partial [Asparagus officinalis]